MRIGLALRRLVRYGRIITDTIQFELGHGIHTR
jgi:hypothetical protein